MSLPSVSMSLLLYCFKTESFQYSVNIGTRCLSAKEQRVWEEVGTFYYLVRRSFREVWRRGRDSLLQRTNSTYKFSSHSFENLILIERTLRVLIHKSSSPDNLRTEILRLSKNGEGGIRTLDTACLPYDGLANRCNRPLCHLSTSD